MKKHFSSFLDAIYQHHGDINETAGDGLMVIFQHEDPQTHARAAVDTALAIARRARQINAQAPDRPVMVQSGHQLRISPGGLLAFLGAGWRPLDLHRQSGPVTNLAACLAGLAKQG